MHVWQVSYFVCILSHVSHQTEDLIENMKKYWVLYKVSKGQTWVKVHIFKILL